MKPLGTAIIASVLISAGVLFAPAPANAQAPGPPVCETEAPFREFDFWLGNWDVYNEATGALAGTNRIESRHGGCLIMEHWTSTGGIEGTSMNYYDNVRGTWRQFWVSMGYSIEIEGGLDAEGRMVLEGELHGYRSRQAVPFRGTWTLRPDGSVRQLFEQLDAATGEWVVWFDGRYEPAGG